MKIKDYIQYIIFLIVVGLMITLFIYHYSQHDSNTTQDDCIPDYMTGDCSF